MVKHIVFYSSGIGSWAAAKRVAVAHGTENVALLFADTLMEDWDNYRFLFDSASEFYGLDYRCPPDFHVPHIRDMGDRKSALNQLFNEFTLICPGLVRVCDGRSMFELWQDNRAIASDFRPFCTEELKQNQSRDWLLGNEPVRAIADWHRQYRRELKRKKRSCPWPLPNKEGEFVLHVGFDWSEDHRLADVVRAWLPWRVEALMMQPPYLDKSQMLELARSHGLRPPRLYDDPRRPHANCGGACTRNGIKAWRLTLETMPDVYEVWEQAEIEVSGFLGKERSMLRDRRGVSKGQKARPLPLWKLRQEVEADKAKGVQVEASNEDASCSCFAIAEPLI